jgi:hypothetical protein
MYRASAVTITVLILVLAGLGLSGRGPLGGLHTVTTHTVSWLRLNTGVGTR